MIDSMVEAKAKVAGPITIVLSNNLITELNSSIFAGAQSMEMTP